MKKFRILSCMLAVVMLLFTFVSCGSKKVLPGTWTLEEETLKTTLEFGEDGKGKATFEAKPSLFGTWVLEMDGITTEMELKEDCTGKMAAMGFEMSFTYTYTDKEITIKLNIVGREIEEKAAYTLEGNTLTVVDVVEGEEGEESKTEVYTKKDAPEIPESYEFTYTEENGKLTVTKTATEGESKEVMDFKVEGDKLTLTKEDKTEQVYTKTK